MAEREKTNTQQPVLNESHEIMAIQTEKNLCTQLKAITHMGITVWAESQFVTEKWSLAQKILRSMNF